MNSIILSLSRFIRNFANFPGINLFCRYRISLIFPYILHLDRFQLIKFKYFSFEHSKLKPIPFSLIGPVHTL